MSKNNHIFIGSSWLLVSQMITKIIKYSEREHHFVIIINADGQQEQYEDLFFHLGHSDYEYWYYIYKEESLFTTKVHLHYLYVKLLLSGIVIRYNEISRWLLIYEMIIHCGFDNIIFHSELSEVALFLGKEKIKTVWCCWGSIPYYSPKTSRLFFKKKEYHYRYFLDNCYSIVVLTEADKKSFEQIYNYNNIVLSSYSYIYDYDNLIALEKQSNRILVGNSAFYMNEYLLFAKCMSTFSGLYYTFMCSYGVDTSSKIFEEWKTRIINYLEPNNSVDFWTENIPLTEYNKKLSLFQIYVAPMNRQSGLGAITTAISLGLKCYLNGVNYDYYSRKGLIIYHFDNITHENNINELLSFDQGKRIYNSNLIKEVCGVKQSIDTWESIYKSLQ